MAKTSASGRPNEKPLLTPPRAALKKALKRAASDAHRLAKAYGVKVPAAQKKD
jgi:hypothetical protein